MTESRAEDKPTEELPFNLARPPFADEPGESGFFPGEQYLRALNFLGHLLWSRASFGVLIAEAGCGKELIARRFLASLDERVLRAYIDQPGLAPHEFLGEVLQQLGMPLEPTDRTDRRRLLEKFLKHHSSYGRICVLIVANAQTLPVRTLEELRQIALLEVDGTRVMKLILMGAPEFLRVAE
jgi:type II secretory pathway predicted ATPase ExeA